MATSESWLSAEEFSRGEVEISKRKIPKQEEATRALTDAVRLYNGVYRF